MGLLSDLLRSAREREKRVGRARDAIAALTLEEKASLLAETIRQISPRIERSRVLRGRLAARKGPAAKFGDVAEAHVCARPGGSTNAEVAAVTGQSPNRAYATLHHVARSRGTVVSKDGRWYPTGKKPRMPVKAIRERISEALAAHAPLSAAGIHAAIERTAPGVVTKAVVATEVTRMRDEGLVTIKSRGAFTLANGGPH